MDLLALADVSVWRALEDEIYDRWQLAASVFNTEGIRVTGPSDVQNNLCKKIKSTSKGQAFICATAQMNLAAMAQKERKPILEECDAGMGKLVVPIFHGDEFVGTAGGCGRLAPEGEIDSFAVNRLTDIEESEIKTLADQVGPLASADWQAVSDFIQQRLKEILKD